MNKEDFIIIRETSRTYHFPNGSVTIYGGCEINVSEDGTHRINTHNNKKHIIPTGWIHIELVADEWTF